ncbi:MAG: hypothetical protein WB781_06000 [Candidatus Sulfotelmatobacter sp.]
MKLHRWIVGWVVVIAGFSSFLTAQQGAATQTASAVPQLVRTPQPPTLSAADDPHQWPEAASSNGSIIVAYVVALELLLAGVAATACLLVLALAGAVVKLQERPAVRQPNEEAIMKVGRNAICGWLLVWTCCCSLSGQLQAAPSSSVVPRLVMKQINSDQGGFYV